MSTQPQLDFTSAPIPDVCARKSRRAPESELANKEIHHRKSEDRTRIYLYILGRGSSGATSHEVERDLSIPLQTVSARMSELKYGKLSLIERTGERRRTGASSPAAAYKAITI